MGPQPHEPSADSSASADNSASADSSPHASAASQLDGEKDAKILPIELTAFGDIYNARRDPGGDDFHIGSLEVDIALSLVPYYFIDPIFFGGRYAVTLDDRAIAERTVTGAAGIEILPQGELRVAYERRLDAQADTLLVQIVGGSNFKPTGLRR